jgi:uncharacterized iron-regulated membrane protein
MTSVVDSALAGRNAFYRTIWRWHFYAGLFVMPFIVLLSVTGAIYLFKPQIDRWEERSFQNLPLDRAVAPHQQAAAALAAYPGARLDSYRLPERVGDAAMIHLATANGGPMRDVFVSPQGAVLGSFGSDARLTAFIARIHGSLLIGPVGDWLVELAASWAIVMILTGLYLWWPRGSGMAGVIWPRLGRGRQLFWRDIHAVTGFWVAGLALVMLASGLPWAGAWGTALRLVRIEFGLMKGPQDWKVGAAREEHAAHDHGAMAAMSHRGSLDLAPIDILVPRARAEKLAFPALIKPPGTPERGGRTTGAAWIIKSEAQNRTLVRTVRYDPSTLKEIGRTDFADRHVIDRVVNYGIAWHEGQLFGWINQLIGVLTATALITMVVSSFILWQRRRPIGKLGAPAVPAVPARIGGVVAIIVVLAALLPLLAASMIILLLIEWLLLRRVNAAAVWLGLRTAA